MEKVALMIVTFSDWNNFCGALLLGESPCPVWTLAGWKPMLEVSLLVFVLVVAVALTAIGNALAVEWGALIATATGPGTEFVLSADGPHMRSVERLSQRAGIVCDIASFLPSGRL